MMTLIVIMKQKGSRGLQLPCRTSCLMSQTQRGLFVSLTQPNNGTIEQTRQVCGVWPWNKKKQMKLAPETYGLIRGSWIGHYAGAADEPRRSLVMVCASVDLISPREELELWAYALQRCLHIPYCGNVFIIHELMRDLFRRLNIYMKRAPQYPRRFMLGF